MNKIDNYQLGDFIQDISFRKWVLGKLPEENQVWENWFITNPEKKMLIEEAKSLVFASQIEEITIPEYQIQQNITAILQRTKPTSNKLFKQNWPRIAASIAAGMLFVWLVNQYDYSKKVILAKSFETENNSTKPLSIKLSDGSTVTLKKGSKLQVAHDFGVNYRTVFLTGEAFFEVQKDNQRPFLVYAGGIVTKVLGTSFNVRAYKNETNTKVAVRSGRVTVYQERKINTKNQDYSEQILLTPNQQVIFEKKIQKLVKTLVEKPAILILSTENIDFKYEETPILDVLNQLEKAYGVKIVFDADILANCNLTAEFADEPLFDKMEIICETIQARYEIADGQIVIYAKGCK